MELLIIAYLWQKSNESLKKFQETKAENIPTIQTWIPIFQENFESITPPILLEHVLALFPLILNILVIMTMKREIIVPLQLRF